MENEGFVKVLISIGGTVCTTLVIALKVLWSKVEKLTEIALQDRKEIGQLQGNQQMMKQLHAEVLKIVEENVKTKT